MTRKTLRTTLKCTCCGELIPIQRRMGKQKKKGHIKTIYCHKCKDVVQCIELGANYDYMSREAFFSC